MYVFDPYGEEYAKIFSQVFGQDMIYSHSNDRKVKEIYIEYLKSKYFENPDYFNTHIHRYHIEFLEEYVDLSKHIEELERENQKLKQDNQELDEYAKRMYTINYQKKGGDKENQEENQKENQGKNRKR